MSERRIVTLSEADGTLAVIAPELGGWLLRYARPVGRHSVVEALHFSQAVVDRYPREMWAGNPLLFPLVGSNRVGEQDHCYEWNGQRFEMPQYGFARRMKWSVVSQTSASLTMELADNETTRASFPFAFRQRLTYSLSQGRLHWEQVIENTGGEPLPFSTGFHPYFRVPLTARSERAACFVEIPAAKRLTSHNRHERFTGKEFPSQNWSVDEDVSGTMFLTELAQRELILVDPVAELEVILNFEDAPQHRFVAIWSKTTDAPFYCLEPWTALPNAFTRQPKDHELILLEARKTFRAAMWMELRAMG
jgi:galactose mutarotase-like enzyme